MHRWCFYGCMMQTNNSTLELATEEMWIPAWIVHVSEKIFEWLPKEQAVDFPLKLLEAIPTWIDTYDIWKKWHYTILMDEEHGQYKYCWDNEECKKAVKQCAELFITDFTKDAAESAAWSAWSAHYEWMRGTLIDLLSKL